MVCFIIMKFSDRIEVDAKVAFGKPIIAGTRISVDFILELLSSGWSIPQILKDYRTLKQEDILACIDYAKQLVLTQKTYPLSILKNHKMREKFHENFSR